MADLITIRATDPDGLYDEHQCTVTVQAAGTVVWNPGNYLVTPLSKDDVADETSQNNAVITRITGAGHPYLIGGVFRLRWPRFEIGLGGYQWSVTDSLASRMQTAGKRFFFQLDTVIFSSTAPPSDVCPAYMLNSTYDGGAQNIGDRVLVKLWNTNCMTRKIAAQNAIINRYKSNPYFEGIVGCETAVGSAEVAGYTASLAYTEYVRLFQELRTAQPNHAMICYLNFYPGASASQWQGVLNSMRTNKWACGGPDSRWEDGGTNGRKYAIGVSGTTDYRGTMAMQTCDQLSGLSSSNYVGTTYGPWTYAKHMDWIKNQFWGNYSFWTNLPSADLFDPIMSGSAANPSASFRSTKPSGY